MENHLKKCLFLIVLLCFSWMDSWGQINMSLLENTHNVRVRMTLKDKDTKEPVSFATAYLIPKGDTTIIDFCLSDQEGLVTFKEIPSGSYEVNVEMMGYHPYKKVHQLKGWKTDLGEIEMEINHEFIRSARISAAANPIRVVQDTVEFTASAFRVGQNAMLEDLLKKMPGMEIENGKVKLNGQEIDRITVGGKTFFFKDQNAALKNLPARIIEKIKVIDRDKDEAAFSGVTTRDDKEKVMDVGLKKEFQKGWFGNVAAAGGTNLNSDQDNELMEKSGVVYNANGMVSGYNEKDQVVFLANGQNVTDPNARMAFFSGRMGGGQEVENAYANMGGLIASAGGGINWNTQRLNGMDIATAVKYDHSTKNSKRKSYRTSFQQEGTDLHSNTDYIGTGHEDGFHLDLELKNTDKKKYHFDFKPHVSFNRNATDQDNRSETFMEGKEGNEVLNTNQTLTSTRADIFTNGLNTSFGMKGLGKDNRNFTVSFDYSSSKGDGQSLEQTHLSGLDKNLKYQMDQQTLSLAGRISYTEPVTDRWSLNLNLRSSYSVSDKTNDAFNLEGKQDDYYSSFSKNQFLQESGGLYMQYHQKTARVQLGANVMASQNVIHTRSLGQETESGKNRWDWKVSPSVSFYMNGKSHRAGIYYNGWTSPVSADLVVPTLDFKDPLQIRTGNVYLKPYFSNQIYTNYTWNNRKTFTFLGLDLNGSMTLNGISNAIWFDQKGVRYAVPVNVRKPQMNVSSYLNINQPFGPDRHFSISAYIGASYSKTDSYQATGILEGLDVEAFDYSSFMDSFWGDPSGNRFYSGESGFAESNTHFLNSWGNVNLKYTGDLFDISLRQSFSNNTSRYSLNPETNTATWNFTTTLNMGIRPGKEWEILTDAGYSWYRGYAEGYGDPQFLWNLRINKNIQAFTLSLSAVDLLNQTRNFRHSVSNEYVEDTYVNAFGRYITLGLTWNFGKKGASQNTNVRNAMFRMQ